MKRALTIGAVAALTIGVSLPATALGSTSPVDAAFAEAAITPKQAGVQSVGVTAAPAAGSAKDTFAAAAEVKSASSGFSSSSYSGPLPDGFGGIVMWPVNAPVNDGFGYRDGGEFHGGIDIMCGSGAVIVAAAPGVITQVAYSGGYGQVVVINHGSGVETYYAHMIAGSPMVSAGDWVDAGTPLGLSGDTGYATVAHLHFELHVGGAKVNPIPYMP